MCYPRVLKKDWRFRRPNKNANIKDGYHVRSKKDGTTYEAPLIDIRHDGSYKDKLGYWRTPGVPFNSFYVNIDRKYVEQPKNKSEWKDWFLLTYNDDALVEFLQFDVDINHNQCSNVVSEIENINSFAEKFGCTPIWTTSPGDLENGKIIHGTYAWVRLSEPVRVKKLRELVPWIRAKWHIESESSFDSSNDLIRMPGQRFVELCNPFIREILNPVQNENEDRESLIYFAKKWKEAKLDDALLDVPMLVQEFEQDKQKVIVSVPMNKTQKKKPVKTSKKQSEDKIPYMTLEQALLEKNTFIAFTARRTASRIVHKYHGKKEHLEQATQECMKELPTYRPSDSRTCSIPNLLCSTSKRVMTWYFDHYDETKSISLMRKKKDAELFSSTSKIELAHLLAYAKKKKALNKQQLKSLSLIYEKMQEYNGRVDCFTMHECCGDAMSWAVFRNKLDNVLSILQEYNQNEHLCRQWGVSEKAQKEINYSIALNEQAKKDAQELLNDISLLLFFKKYIVYSFGENGKLQVESSSQNEWFSLLNAEKSKKDADLEAICMN